MRVGVVADDITGANDIGIMFAKNDYVTHVYADHSFDPTVPVNNAHPDVVILDTDSRFDSGETAYDKVYTATIKLQQAGSTFFFNKTCSVFRGNIGREFDAMLDALGESFAVVVLGFPKNGRTTVEGIHHVRGVKLEDSEFRDDPMHPMNRSNLVDILQAQTNRKVALLSHTYISDDTESLRQCISEYKTKCNYLILDVTDQTALYHIAKAVAEEKIVCGSSAIAEELPKIWGAQAITAHSSEVPAKTAIGVLCAAGSLMPQTRSQIEFMAARNTPVFMLDSLRLFNKEERESEIDQLVERLNFHIRRGDDVVVHSDNRSEMVGQMKQLGLQKGLTSKEISRLVSEAMAEIVEKTVKSTGLNRMVIAGGDTSASVCSRLGITGMSLWKEIQPGLPSCLSLTDPPILFVLKSGSFGTEDFFVQAIDHLKKQ